MPQDPAAPGRRSPRAVDWAPFGPDSRRPRSPNVRGGHRAEPSSLPFWFSSFGVSVPIVRLPDQRGLTPISARAPRAALDHTRPRSVRRDLRRHDARPGLRRRDAAGAAALRPRPARRGRPRGRRRHRLVRDHRARLPADRRPLRRPARAAGGRDRRRRVHRDRRPPVLRARGDRRADRRAAVPRRRRGPGLHRGLGLGGRPRAARSTGPAHRALRARDLGRALTRAADRRADPARHQLRGRVGVRGRRAARRRPDRPADPRAATSLTPPARTSTGG